MSPSLYVFVFCNTPLNRLRNDFLHISRWWSVTQQFCVILCCSYARAFVSPLCSHVSVLAFCLSPVWHVSHVCVHTLSSPCCHVYVPLCFLFYCEGFDVSMFSFTSPVASCSFVSAVSLQVFPLPSLPFGLLRFSVGSSVYLVSRRIIEFFFNCSGSCLVYFMGAFCMSLFSVVFWFCIVVVIV